MSGERTIRVGLIGPGRRRNGLGPFLACWLERAGARVVAAAGRDAARTRADCDRLASQLGHAVDPVAPAGAIAARRDLDALVVATPPDAHLDGLRCGLELGVPTLCEKPMVPVEQSPRLWAVLDEFEARAITLVENCQWPETLSGVRELHPELPYAWLGRAAPPRAGGPRELVVRLSPSRPGTAGLEDSLSHLLSLVQAIAPVGPDTLVADPRLEREAEDAMTLSLRFERPFAALAARLELVVCRTQPRPAWLSIDGYRADRLVRREDYSIALAAADRQVAIDDPLGRLVQRFVGGVADPKPERAAAELAAIRQRARLYAEVLGAVGGRGRTSASE